MIRTKRALMLAAASAVAILGAPTAASAAIQPVGANQYFKGQVNGVIASATVHVRCGGTAGNPVAGQTVAVITASPTGSPNIGFTGSAATEIDAQFPAPGGKYTSVPIYSYFNNVAIPTSLVLPCTGTGTVTFAPSASSATAHSYTVSVTFAP